MTANIDDDGDNSDGDDDDGNDPDCVGGEYEMVRRLEIQIRKKRKKKKKKKICRCDQ